MLFALALTQTAFYWGSGASSSGPGWQLLLKGWRGLSGGYLEWLANPSLLMSWLLALRGWRAGSAACAAVATVSMLVFLLRQSLVIPGLAEGLHAISPGPGYWLWLGSALIMVAAPLRRGAL